MRSILGKVDFSALKDQSVQCTPAAVVLRVEMAKDGAEHDADWQCPPGDAGKLVLARRKLIILASTESAS